MFGSWVQMGAAKDKAFIPAVFSGEFKTIYRTLPGDNGPAQAFEVKKQGDYISSISVESGGI